MLSKSGIKGFVRVELWKPLANGELALAEFEDVENLVTQYGDQYYGEAAAGVAVHSPAIGMRLGTGATAAAKTGAGAAIVTYLTGSNRAFEATYPQSALNGSSRRISHVALWAAGVATNAAITEAVITNETPLTNVAGVAGDTVSRVVFAAKDKQAADTLTITWHHDMLGS